MATVGNANIDITADSGQAEGAISGFMGSLRRIGSIATGVMGGLALFDTLKSTFSGLYDSTIGANASMEQYQNTLSIVLNSSEKAADMMNWVKDFAASTPFEIPGLVEATTAMSAYGLNAQQWLPLVGDMASVMGKDIMQATEAIADAQTGELERLKEFGVTKDQIIAYGQEMRMAAFVNNKGQITDQAAFNQALMGLMKERFEGGMAIQSTSFKGLISNAQDSMGQLLTTMSQPLFEGLKEGLSSVVPIMGAFTAAFQGDWLKAREQLVGAFGEDTAMKIEVAFTRIFAAFHSLKEFVLSLQPTWENLKRIFIGLLPVFQMVGGAIAVLWGVISEYLPPILEFITDIAAKIVEWEGFVPLIAGIAAGFVAFKATAAIVNGVKIAMTAFQTVLWAVRNATFLLRYGMMLLNSAFLANPIAWVVALIVGLIAVFVTLYKRNEAFRELVDKVWAAIKNAFASVIEWATTTLPAWWESLKQGFSDFVEATVGFFQSLGERIMAFLQPFITFFVQSWENLKLLVLGIIQVFISLVTGNFEGLKLGLLAIWTAIKNQALAYWQLLKDTVIQLVVNLWNGAVNLFQSGKDKVINFVKNAKDGVVNGFREAKDNAIQRVKDMWNGIVTWVGKIPGKFQEMKDNIIQKVKSIDLVEIGKDIVRGLINGIGSMIESVKKKAREIAGGVEEAIRKRLDSRSPSRVMVDVGYDTGTGFIIGMNDTISQATAKAKELGGAVADAVGKASEAIPGGLFQFGGDNPLAKYFNAIIEDGDWMNDWVTHLPQNMRGQVMELGKQFAQFEGLQAITSGSQQGFVTEQHVHYWQINADEITDVASLIDVVNGIVQTVRSR
ncbi:phage tail protein [Neobacillus sp. C211]|uniref:phage tail protein n=1 Tax=unclassified Neobacillus TaxID=2675272 RepID=UPI00397B3129